MTRRPRRGRPGPWTGLAAVGLIALGSGAAWADPEPPGRDHVRARELREAGTIVPFGVILKHTNAHHPGRVLSVKLEEQEERYLYEVEVLDKEGVVWALFYDAATGDLIQTMEEADEIYRDGD